VGYSIVGHARVWDPAEGGVRCLAIIDASVILGHDVLCSVPRREVHLVASTIARFVFWRSRGCK